MSFKAIKNFLRNMIKKINKAIRGEENCLIKDSDECVCMTLEEIKECKKECPLSLPPPRWLRIP